MGWANYQLASGIDDNGDDAYFQADAWDGTLSAGLQLSIPVSVWFPWSKEASTNRKSQIQLQDLELQYQSVVSGVRLAVESSILKIAEEEAKIASGTKSVELAQRLYDSAVEQYESGYISSTDLRDAQLSLNGARLGYAQAIYGYNGNVLALMDAVGVSSF